MTNPTTNGASLSLTAESPGELNVHTIASPSNDVRETHEVTLKPAAIDMGREPFFSVARPSSDAIRGALRPLLWHFTGRVSALREHAHAHHKAYHRVHGVLHLGYLGMVTMHGPYYIPAGLLFLVILIGYVLHLESDA